MRDNEGNANCNVNVYTAIVKSRVKSDVQPCSLLYTLFYSSKYVGRLLPPPAWFLSIFCQLVGYRDGCHNIILTRHYSHAATCRFCILILLRIARRAVAGILPL